MSKRKGAPRTRVTKKSNVIEFTKTQRRLLLTIQDKHNQAMNTELNAALMDVYAEHDYDPETDEREFRLRDNFSGLDLVTGSMQIPDATLERIAEIEKGKQDKKEEEPDAKTD